MLTPKEFSDLLASAEDVPARRAEEQQQREQRTRDFNVSSGLVKCSECGAWFYDTPGNFCSHP